MNSPLRDQSDGDIWYLSCHAPEYFQDEISAEIDRRINERLNQSGGNSPSAFTTTSQPMNLAKNMPRNRFYREVWGNCPWVGAWLVLVTIALLAFFTMVMLIWTAK